MQRIVVPGEKISDAPMRLEHTIVENNATYSTVVGAYDDEHKTLVPLEGLWYPMHGDTIVGVIEEDKLNTYVVNLNAPYKGLLLAKFTEIEITTGDVVEGMVKELDKTQTAMLMRPRKLVGGKLIAVKPSKIPRIIGKGNTMIKELSEGTGCNIIVGQNGMIWLKGGNIDLATKAILKIEEEAHTTGLTERIKQMLQSEK
jgi:exosome complex component RRP4